MFSWRNWTNAWWRHQMEAFSALLAICAGNSPHKGQWRGALMFSLICVWKNGWVNNREAGDFRRYRVHYDVTVMEYFHINDWKKPTWPKGYRLPRLTITVYITEVENCFHFFQTVYPHEILVVCSRIYLVRHWNIHNMILSRKEWGIFFRGISFYFSYI